MKFNNDSRNALLAVTFGDGYIEKGGSGKIVHSIKQKDYLEWKVDFLRKSGLICSDPKPIGNGGFEAVKVYINTTNFGKVLRRILYKNGYKNIYNRKLLNRFTPIHIAIWYMDDGGISQKKKNGKVHANDLMLNTHTTIANNQIIIDYFKEVWGVNFTQVKNKGWYRLRCGTKEARKFVHIVSPFVSQVKSMSHKLNLKY